MKLYDRDDCKEEDVKKDCNNNNSCCHIKRFKNFINFFKDENGKWSIFRICLVALPIGILCPALTITLLAIGGGVMLFVNDCKNDKFS